MDGSRGDMTFEWLAGMFGADGVVRVADAPVGHEPTRRWLAEVGVPREAADIRLDGVAEPRTAGEMSSKPLPPGIAEMRVLGTAADPAYVVLLDETTGRVFAGYFDILADGHRPELLASDLPALVRLAAAVTCLSTGTGEFAAFADRYGPAVVADMTQTMLGLIREYDPKTLDVSDEISAHWRVAAHIWPLARVAAPGGDLALDFSGGLLGDTLDMDALFRYDDADLPDALTHEPTRRFLREHGIVEEEANYCILHKPAETFTEDGGEAVTLGSIADEIELVIDGATGSVHGWSGADGVRRPVSADVSTFVFAQWLVRQVQILEPEHRLLNAEAALVTTLTRVLASVDPVACRPTGDEDDYRYWPELFSNASADGIFD